MLKFPECETAKWEDLQPSLVVEHFVEISWLELAFLSNCLLDSWLAIIYDRSVCDRYIGCHWHK